MIYDRLREKWHWFGEQSEIYKIIIMYRFGSLAITSLFYFISQPTHSMGRKLFFISCTVGSAILLNYLYIRSKGNTRYILLILLVETCGNSLLLIPSGGINSPYVWYSLNTLLMASFELSGKYCWLNLAVYLVASASLSVLMPTGNMVSFFTFTESERNLVLSLILITSVIQLLSKYASNMHIASMKLRDSNQQLQQANIKITEAFNHIMEVYQAVNLFSMQGNRDELVKLILGYIQKITKARTIFFYNLSSERTGVIIQAEKKADDLSDKVLEERPGIWNEIVESKAPKKMKFIDKDFTIIPIYSDNMNYGVLGIELPHDENDASNNSMNNDLLSFLSKLSAIAIERFDLEQVNDRLIVTEEQDRIANEIHDNVLQRLFSISCGIYNLKRNLGNKQSNMDLNQELEVIRDSVNSSMNELRSAIYGLSWKKNGADNFIADIYKYIKQIKCMNNIRIDFKVNGNSELLISMQKRAIYRIICEAIGNAIRHGRADTVNINLNIDIQDTILQINDNGKGFDVGEIEVGGQHGLGIRNIKFLVNSLRGDIKILSSMGEGTRIHISVPNLSRNIGGERLFERTSS